MNMSAIDIAGLEGGRVNLTSKQLDELEARLEGPLLRPGDEGWDDAVLIWNGMVAVRNAPEHLLGQWCHEASWC